MASRTRTIAAVLLAILAPAAGADTVYKAPGGAGPVYSDFPQPGSKPLELPPVNVVPALPMPPPKLVETPVATEAAAFSYRSLRIIHPEDMGSISDNTALFEVRVAADPPLARERGHAYALRLNGRDVPRRFVSDDMLVPPEFFGDSTRVQERFVIQARIVDRDGRTLIEAPPVDVTMRAVRYAPPGGARPLPPVHPMPRR